MAGGPPVRGDLLTYWEPVGPLAADDRQRWLTAAIRIATGLYELAHVIATIDVDLGVLAFSCGTDAGLAARYDEGIHRENVEARVIAGRDGQVGVALPCRPDATDEEINHVVLAVVKTAHALEFGPEIDPAVLAQLEAVRAVEQYFVDLRGRVRSFGGAVKQGFGRLVRPR